jgi:2-polyprenyl-6-methoxyphenol hydroxylase-like FAD-dependent oxidoreductase
VPRILITGASVAGPALAFWLSRDGWDVTVLERHDELREEGQNVDVRHAGREAARRMGIEDAIRDATTGEEGTAFVDGDGRPVATFDATGDDSATAELEVLRGDLSRIVVDRAAARARFVFGDHVERLHDDGVAVTVGLASGREETFDVVAVAEGLRSSTRDLVFEDVELRPLGADIAYLTIPRAERDGRLWEWYNAPGGRMVSLRPDAKGTTRAMLSHLAEPQGDDRLDRAGQEAVLRERFAGAGWETDRILDAMPGAPMYYESLAQVHAPSWSRGRVVLLGDAAHAPSPMGGLGASLALVDGYVLAGELVRSPEDPAAAFRRFEEIVRPYAEDAQDLPPGTPRVAHPRTELGVRVLRLGQRVAAGPAGALVQKVLPSTDHGFELPTYDLRGESPASAPPAD